MTPPIGDVSVLAAELIQRLEAMVPPADLVEWHHLYIELFRTVQAMYDRFPKDDVIDNAKMDEFLLAVAPRFGRKVKRFGRKVKRDCRPAARAPPSTDDRGRLFGSGYCARRLR